MNTSTEPVVLPPLPIVTLPIASLSSAPSHLTEPTAQKAVDTKLSAAIKHAIEVELDVDTAALLAVIEGLTLDYREVAGLTLDALIRRQLVPALLGQPAFAELARALEDEPEDPSDPTLASLFSLDTPLADHPLFVVEVRQAQVRELLRISALDPRLVERLDAFGRRLEAWTEIDWARAVDEKILTTEERDTLYLSTELSRLTGEHYPLVEAVRSAKVNSLNDVLTWEAGQWTELFRQERIAIPDGATATGYADLLVRNLSTNFLSEAFCLRIANPALAQAAVRLWAELEPLRRHNPDLLNEPDTDDIDWTDIPERERAALDAQRQELAVILNLYGRLDLRAVLADSTLSMDKQLAQVGALIDELVRAIGGATTDLRLVNLLDERETRAKDIMPAPLSTPARNQLLAYQRVLHLAHRHDTAMALLGAGYDSSFAVAGVTLGTLMDRTGLSRADAAPIHRRAMHRATRVAHGVQVMKDATSGIEQGRHYQGIDPAFVNDLKDVPGYADLFGSTTYCDCEHCRSIFSPAAYFTDLMYFIDTHITKKAFVGKPSHPLRLNLRRPDLWKLPLTCDNTDTLIPHLTLVNEILTAYLQHTLAVADVPLALAADRSAIGLPFHQPLATVREYLSDWDTTLAETYELLGAAQGELNKETLRLSDQDWNGLTAPALDTQWIHFPTPDHTQMEVPLFLSMTGLSRDALDELQATKTAGGFTIVRYPLSNDIQSEAERVEDLNDARLDAIGRFLRLARKSGYGLTELDEILQTSKVAGATKFGATSLANLAAFKRLARSLALSVESMVAVLDHVPTRPMKPDALSLSDAIGVPALTAGAAFPLPFHHARYDTANPSDAQVDPRLPALLNLLGVREADLLALFDHYATVFTFNANGDCQLTADGIDLLYAHVTLARACHLAPAELSLIVDKLLPLPSGDFRELPALQALSRVVAMLQAVPFAIGELFALLDPAQGSVTLDQMVGVVSLLQQSGARLFTTAVLTALPGIQNQDALDIFASLSAANLIKPEGDKWALAAAYTPATDIGPSLPAAFTARKAELHGVLMGFHFTNFLPNALAPLAALPPDGTLVALAFAPPGWDGAAILQALASPIVKGVAQQPADLQPLVTLAGGLARLGQIFNRLQLTTDDLWFIARYPGLLEIVDIHNLSPANVYSMRRYRQWRASTALTAAQGQNLLWQYHVRTHGNVAVPPAAVIAPAMSAVPVFGAALAAPELAPFQPAAAPAFTSEALVPSPLNADEILLLAGASGLDPTLWRSIFLSQKLPALGIDGLERAAALYAFCTSLRLQGASLPKLLKRDFAGLRAAADLLWSTLQDKYPDQAGRGKHLSPHTAALNNLLRDALCDYIIARADMLNFHSRGELYAYFLIDVEMDGCFDTSRLVAAISSCQLYVYRCLVNLEQSQKDNFSVLSFIDIEDVSQQWEWRKNYRVWEANRKVFVWPENYIEPELRDNKTPLFKDLEDSLLQAAITVDAAQDAYSVYLTGFSELAQLKAVGSYHDSDKDCYYFFGRTHNDPYKYYFRKYHHGTRTWDAWQNIDLGINGPYVSPIVHLGRLYIFWMEVMSADKTSFVDGNSVFISTQHHATLQYSHLLENNRWAAVQKKQFSTTFVDRYVIDQTPAWLTDLVDNFKFLSYDKDQTDKLSAYYKGTKTYLKVIVTADQASAPEKLTVHYFRKRKFFDVLIKNKKTKKTKPVSDTKLDQSFVAVDTKHSVVVPDDPGHGYQYCRATLDLLLNDLSAFTVDDSEAVGADLTSEQVYYSAQYGTQAVGTLDVSKSLGLVYRSYAKPENPAATDDMLESGQQENGVLLTSTVSRSKAHDIQPVNNRQEDTVLQSWKNQHWIHHKTGSEALTLPRHSAIRINTTLDSFLSRVLFVKGIDQFLSLATQTTQGEEDVLFNVTVPNELLFEGDPDKRTPYEGSFGDYYRELFFHIPFLIAAHLNGDGKFADAKYWYEKIFNPTAKPIPNDPVAGHRVWQYYEFRDVVVPTLKKLLTDPATIEVYHKDPFNPHAIARLRLSAYQKSIVMKYVDNLIDWGDDLFTQDTMESINEATMLYVLALEILGPRPVSIGKCSGPDDSALTYAKLAPGIALGSEFLIYVENIYAQYDVEKGVRATLPNGLTMSPNVRSSGLDPTAYRRQPRVQPYAQFAASTAPSTEPAGSPLSPAGSPLAPAGEVVRHYIPAFCVPVNDVLLGYWDRIADRLFKIRHCMNIRGEKRALALFQPPIDPMLLVRAKAAGISIEDIVSQQNEALPPYRFTYLVEKSRQYISMVQILGNALLSALEKKDAEALALLRSVHEQNILSMMRNVKKQQVVEANTALQGLDSQLKNVQNRVDYYSDLVSGGLNAWEVLEQSAKTLAAGVRASQGTAFIGATIAYLLPQIGSPFAMKYGGKEAGDSAHSTAEFLKVIAETADNVAIAAGIQAVHERRAQEWQHQLDTAQEELKQIGKQVAAAELRVQIAERELATQEKQIEHSKELHDFYTGKFSNEGLYTYLSTQLMRLYREAYQMAAQLARQAERAFQFERDATDFFIQGDNWQSERSGLLAGDRLQVQLQRLEKAYMERNFRELEVSQSFSLALVDPAALQDLQQNGICTFKLSEPLFDMVYPGQYRRLLKSVRLTIPCVAGPYTNIGATLQLNGSQLRRDPKAGLVDVPLTMTSTIATSHAQNDAGVFELNFRDERYLPFEGAGAVSTWSLSLPSKVRMFNYDTISDVVINLSYCAKYDGAFAGTVENGMLASLKSFSQTTGLFRLVSVRQEFPDAFYQLLNPAPGQPQQTAFTLESRHFPSWLHGQTLQLAQVVVYPRPVKGQTLNVNALTLKVAGSTVGGWSGGKGTAAVSGSPLRSWALDAGTPGFDKAQLDDLFLLLKYQIF